MAFRQDIHVDFHTDPRLVWIEAPSTVVNVQDLLDTLRVWEANPIAADDAELVSAAGKEQLGGGVMVGLTVTLLNAKVAFEPRTDVRSEGACTDAGTDPRAVLVDAAAHFVDDGVVPGDLIYNHTDGSVSTVIHVHGQTELHHYPLHAGDDNQWAPGDHYQVFQVYYCEITGGNLVAVDALGNEMLPILPTANVCVVRTSSSSATLQEQEAIQYASYGGVVSVDLLNGEPGVDYPVGNREHPVNNIPNAITIARTKGLPELLFLGNATLGAGHDLHSLILAGVSNVRCHLEVQAGASVLGCEFRDATVNGVLDGNARLFMCLIESLNYVEGAMRQCLLRGTVTLMGTGDTELIDCHGDDNADPNPANWPTINVGSGRNLCLQGFGGGIRLTNVGAGALVVCNLRGAHVIIDSSCSAGKIVLRGVTGYTDGHTGTCVVDTTDVVHPSTVSDQVWDEMASEHTIPGSMGKKLGDAGASSAPWDELVADHQDPGTFGKLVKQTKNLTATTMAKVLGD